MTRNSLPSRPVHEAVDRMSSILGHERSTWNTRWHVEFVKHPSAVENGGVECPGKTVESDKATHTRVHTL